MKEGDNQYNLLRTESEKQQKEIEQLKRTNQILSNNAQKNQRIVDENMLDDEDYITTGCKYAAKCSNKGNLNMRSGTHRQTTTCPLNPDNKINVL